ncbi:hypothetical protein Syun_025285 [Stephania yunnanensis]|uniref:Uncharacterized protein n=1 Tax=Stephania yunnanensis TaxID=152371 RepID=A0AAP0EU06_9MAGN
MVRFEKNLTFYIKHNLVGAADAVGGSGSGCGRERSGAAARERESNGGKSGKRQGRGLRGGWGRDEKKGREGGGGAKRDPRSRFAIQAILTHLTG